MNSPPTSRAVHMTTHSRPRAASASNAPRLTTRSLHDSRCGCGSHLLPAQATTTSRRCLAPVFSTGERRYRRWAVSRGNRCDCCMPCRHGEDATIPSTSTVAHGFGAVRAARRATRSHGSSAATNVTSLRRFDCAAVDERLPWYVNDTLEHAARRTLEAHIATCTICRERLEIEQQLAASPDAGYAPLSRRKQQR
jgi:hypothetical protein